MSENIEPVDLHETTQKRYLNYALSVITSRALPDVRDGLKPVQRRILYAMQHNLSLNPDSKHRKSAAVIGEVMAKYHPHGDQSIYDAMVRMAQPFSLRYPLVDGQGNFGSLDGDGAAAMRYTEAKLRYLAMELLTELRKNTVDTRQNYDGTQEEPVVLPAQFPNLLVNGASGIAVGMATNIPPHNIGEVLRACIALIDKPEMTIEELVDEYIHAPDFPNSPAILNSREELLNVYRTGSGPIEMRGEYEMEKDGRRSLIVIHSIPYGLNKASLITDIAGHIEAGNVPQLIDIRDESTDEIRVVLELKRGADAEKAMAYLYKRTTLQSRFSVNMTCLIPVGNPNAEQTVPRKLDLREVLEHFLEFRYEVTRRRLTFDLEQLERRIHILRGFAIVFDALDEAIKIIRNSKGKNDARDKLMERFALDYEQSEAILETKLYRLAKMEINAIRAELKEKEGQAKALRKTLGNENKMWTLIRDELSQILDAYGDERLSPLSGPVEIIEYSEEAYILDEDAFCIVTRDGWIKRQKSYTEVDSIRVREGDVVGWIVPASTRETLVVLTNTGRAYTVRVDDVNQTTGYGDPIQTMFDFDDGEHVVGVASTDKRTHPPVPEVVRQQLEEGDPPPPWIVAVTRGGRIVRTALDNFAEPSTKNGRYYMRLDSKVRGDAVVDAKLCVGHELVSLITHNTHALLFPVKEVNILAGAGKGVMAIKLSGKDYVVGFETTTHRMHGITAETDRGRIETIRSNKYSVTSRGNRGRQLSKTGTIVSVHREPLELKFREQRAASSSKISDEDADEFDENEDMDIGGDLTDPPDDDLTDPPDDDQEDLL